MLKSECPIDELVDGGFKDGYLYSIFALEDVGKSLFSMQLACKCAKEGGKVLYFDIDDHWKDDVIDYWYGIFSKRFGVDKETLYENIDLIVEPNFHNFFEFFGFSIQIWHKGEKSVITWQFPQRGKSDIQQSRQTKGWFKKSKIWEKMEKKKYRLLIIDSWGTLMKSMIPQADQNYGTRSSFTTFFFVQCLKPLCLHFKIPILLTNHGLGFRGQIMSINPYGGSSVGYQVKYNIGLTKISAKKWDSLKRKLRDDAKREQARLAFLWRHPTKATSSPERFTFLYLEKDFGFTSLPYKEKKARVVV